MSFSFLINPLTPESLKLSTVPIPPCSDTFVAYIIAHSVRTDEGYFLWICKTAHDAQRAYEALLPFLPRQRIGLLPCTWDDPQAPRKRQAALNQLVSKVRPNVLISTPRALIERAPPRSYLLDSRVSLTKGAAHPREDLRYLLKAIGFSETDPVEDRGTFCFRGDRLDVFPLEEEAPLRVEFFDDEVERIRPFSPDSQKTLGVEGSERKHLEFGPVKPFSLVGTRGEALRERLKNFADSTGIPKQVRDPWLEDLRANRWIEAAHHWLPFADLSRSCALSLISKDTQVVSDEVTSKFSLPDPHDIDPENRALPPLSELFLLDSFEEVERLPRRFALNSESGLDSLKVTPISHLSTLTRHSQDALIRESVASWQKNNALVQVVGSTEGRVEKVVQLLKKFGDFNLHRDVVSPDVQHGFFWPHQNWVLVTHSDFFGDRTRKKKTSRHWSGLDSTSTLMERDLVIHVDHGLGRYLGLTRLNRDGIDHEFVSIEYRDGAKLLLPVYRVNTIQRHSSDNPNVSLDRLGGQDFARAKDLVKKSVRKLAFDLVDLYAKRTLAKGTRMEEPGVDYLQFTSQFPFLETEDQQDAIDAVIQDLTSGKVMDRLVVGDVGFGKTEVAMRAAFIAATSGHQVAVLVPTTILAMQHQRTFDARFKDSGLLIESISRFTPTSRKKEILAATREGRIDILIGTHRLLSSDLSFKNLGLVIVDEEHRFGVEHKEKLKSLKVNTHFLTLTATPIPRTLNLSLSGVRDISVIATPPKERLPIRTMVRNESDEIIRAAIEFERARGGQIFFLHNRIDELERIESRLKSIIPDLKIIVAHGQLSELELEKRMLSFYAGEAAVLLCTTIIESGLDIPNANTLIVSRAEHFGLAQLYQIRGRVGRSDRRAYAYLLTGPQDQWTPDAQKRMDVIERFVELGSGFSIASHDLEIRGGGALLGKEQSGHIGAIGFDLYHELLQQAMESLLKPGAPIVERYEPEIRVLDETYIPADYIADVRQRLHYYRLLSQSQSFDEIDQIEEELNDRFGPLPSATQALLWIGQIKRLLLENRIDVLTQGTGSVSIRFRSDTQVDLSRLSGGKLTGDGRLILPSSERSLKALFFLISDTLDRASRKP